MPTYDLTPEEWRDTLVNRLAWDTEQNLRRLAWYTGNQHPPAVPAKYLPSYELLLEMSTNPFAGLVVDAIADRVELTGIRLDQPQADLEIWRILEENHIDATQREVHVESLTYRYGYMSVWPTNDEAMPATIVPESALQVTHEEDPANGKTIAVLKMWTDEIANVVYSNLYLPDGWYQWQAPPIASADSANPDGTAVAEIVNRYPEQNYQWTPRGMTAEELADATEEELLAEKQTNPFDPELPFVPFPNRPALVTGGTSEIDDLLPILKRIDKLTLDMMLAAEVGAFRQKWATGLEVPVNPETQEAIEPFDAAIRKLWVSESPDTKFGDFGATDLQPYLTAIDSQVATLSAVSRVPAHYLLSPSLVNPPSAETAMAADAGLVQKAETQMKTWGEAYEQVTRLVLIAGGQEDRADINIEAVWEDPRNRSEAQVADAAVKWSGLEVPLEVLWSWGGATPEEIQRWKTLNAQQALTAEVLGEPTTVDEAQAEQEADPDAAPSGEEVQEASIEESAAESA